MSWWNDLVVNIPLAYAVATIFGLISPSFFPVALVGGYWLSNIAGLVLLHLGTQALVGKSAVTNPKAGSKKLVGYFLLSLVYTLVIIVLLKLSILRFPIEYFGKRS